MSHRNLPDRVYDIQKKEVISRSDAIHKRYQYVTISHRWNNDEKADQNFLGITWECQKSNVDKLLMAADIVKKKWKSINYIWMDSMCVDQETMKTQIVDMHAVYKKSEWTLTLIKIDEMNLQRIRQLIDKLHEIDSKILNDNWEAFRSVMDHEWWKRIWTLQEMLLSREKMVFFDLDKNEICSFQEYLAIYELYRKMEDKKELLREHDIYKGTGTPCVHEVMAMCQNRQSTREEDHAYGIAGLLNVRVSFRYGFGIHLAMRYLFKSLARRGDLTFLDYWGVPSRSSFMPNVARLGYVAHPDYWGLQNLSSSPYDSTIQEAKIDEKGLHLQLSKPVELNSIRILHIETREKNIAKGFLLAGRGDGSVYKDILRSIQGTDDQGQEEIIGEALKYHLRCPYSNVEIFSGILRRYDVEEDLQFILTTRPGETVFLADTAEKRVAGCVYCREDLSHKGLCMLSVPGVSFPILLRDMGDKTYRMIGRIKTPKNIESNENKEEMIIWGVVQLTKHQKQVSSNSLFFNRYSCPIFIYFKRNNYDKIYENCQKKNLISLL